jgi:ElaB/YqjD/DUF883 family membrane-anchored ribosome-binding protein
MANNSKPRSSDESSTARRKSGEASGSGEDDVVSVTSRVAGKAKDAVKDRLEGRVEKSVNDLDVLAKTLKLASQQLDGNIAAPAIEKVAQGVDRLAKYIEDADTRALLSRAESLGRDNPLLFVGGAAVIGFFGGRFLKASGRSRPPAKKSGERSIQDEAARVRAAAPGRGASARRGKENGASAGAERRA